MSAVIRAAQLVALALTVVPCGLLVAGSIEAATNRALMTAGTALWFAVQLVDLKRNGR